MSTMPDAPPARRPAPRKRYIGLALLIIANVLIELLLEAADYGLVGSGRWRSLAYQYGAFWAGLLHDWQPNYAAQPYVMFVSYAFLHAGFSHMATNMLALWTLGVLVVRQMGPRAFALIYFAAMLGGGAGFGLLSHSPQPMVGASGAIFGLIGAWQYLDWHQRRRTGLPVKPLLRSLFVFLLLNVALWAVMQGQLAWETHLGGFAAGWGVAALLMRLRPPEPGYFEKTRS